MKQSRIYIITIIEALMLLAIVGCKSTEYIPVESVRDVYHNTTDTVRDSIYHDVFVNQYIKGDTIYINKTEYLYKDKWQNHTDTLCITDSVQVPYPVEKKLTKWQQIKQDYFSYLAAVLLAVLAAVIIYIRRNFLKLL